MRLFIAIEIPDAVKHEMAKAQERLRRSGVEAGWTRPEGVHLTLRFLGEVNESLVADIIAALKGAVGGTGGLHLDIAGAGAFPNPGNPRVAWIGVSGDVEKLAKIQAAVEDAVAGLGFTREDRKFSPHLTLARIRRIGSRGRWLAALEEIKNVRAPGFDADSISLMKSELKPSGAVYAEVGRVNLK